MSDYIEYTIIRDLAENNGGGSSGGGSGCGLLLRIFTAIFILIATIATIDLNAVFSILILIIIPSAGLFFYSKIKCLKHKKVVKKGTVSATPSISNMEFIIVSVCSIILFFALFIGSPFIKASAVQLYSHFSASPILEEYQIKNYDIKAKTYFAAANTYYIMVYVEIPADEFHSLPDKEKLEMIDQLNRKIIKFNINSNTGICVDDKVYTVSYAGGPHMETENYSSYHGFLKNFYQFGKY